MPVFTQILRPLSFLLVLLSLLIALLLNATPWNIRDWNLPPDFVALLLLYWGINQPHRVGLLLAFVLGIAMDVLMGAGLGAHSLAYCIAMYFVLRGQRQFGLYPFWQQAVVVFILMLVIQTANLIINITLLRGTFHHWGYFVSSFTTAILWIPLSNIILFVQRRPDKSML
jgi:rod shape-determining protein MreD